MTKGRLPVLFILLISALQLTRPGHLIAQNDTVKLESVEVLECYARDQKKKMIYTFDSLSYASDQWSDVGTFLNNQTGIYLKDYGPGSTSTLSYRGNSANHTKVYWEGISVDNAQLGMSDLSLINLGQGMKAEFLKGGNSIDQGSGGFGGILNLTSATDKWKGMKVATGYGFGSFNTYGMPLDLFLGNGKTKLEINAHATGSENNYEYENYLDGNQPDKRENAAYRRIQIMPKFSARLSDRSEISLSYWHLNALRQVPAAIGTTHGNAQQSDVWNRGQFSYVRKGQKGRISVSTMLSEDYMLYTNENLSLSSDNRVKSFKNLFEYKAQIARLLYSESQVRAEFQHVETINYDGDKSRRMWSFYEGLNYRRPRYYVRPFIRLENYGSQDNLVLPGLNLGYKPIMKQEFLWIFANVNYNERYPTFNELYWLASGNPDLKNESSYSAEIGVEHKLLHLKKFRHWNANYTITAYHSEISNLIAWVPQGAVWKPQNVTKVRNKGFEVEGKFTYSKKSFLTYLSGGYIYTNSTIVSNEEFPEFNDRQQIYVPEHKGHVAGNITINHYYITYTQSFTGQVYIDSDNSASIPYNMPSSVEVGRRIILSKSSILLSFKVNNVYNEDYQYVAHMPMPLRHYNASIIYQFTK